MWVKGLFELVLPEIVFVDAIKDGASTPYVDAIIAPPPFFLFTPQISLGEPNLPMFSRLLLTLFIYICWFAKLVVYEYLTH